MGSGIPPKATIWSHVGPFRGKTSCPTPKWGYLSRPSRGKAICHQPDRTSRTRLHLHGCRRTRRGRPWAANGSRQRMHNGRACAQSLLLRWPTPQYTGKSPWGASGEVELRASCPRPSPSSLGTLGGARPPWPSCLGPSPTKLEAAGGGRALRASCPCPPTPHAVSIPLPSEPMVVEIIGSLVPTVTRPLPERGCHASYAAGSRVTIASLGVTVSPESAH